MSDRVRASYHAECYQISKACFTIYVLSAIRNELQIDDIVKKHPMCKSLTTGHDSLQNKGTFFFIALLGRFTIFVLGNIVTVMENSK